jgi:hypothetical protein
MKKIIITLSTVLGLSAATILPANAQFWGGYGGWGYGGYGYGYGGYGAALGITAGAALLGGVIGGAMASQSYGYGGYYAPGYYYPQQPVRRTIRKNVIIKNSPGATVIEEDDFGW